MTLFPEAIFGGYGFGNFGWGIPAPQPVDAAPDVDAKAKPDQGLERPLSFTSYGYGYDDAEPPSLGLYWQMRQYSAIVLAYAAITCPIFAGTRTLEIQRRDGTTATAAESKPGLTGIGVEVKSSPEDQLRERLKHHFEPLWPDILSGLECLNFGYWLQEVSWERRDGLVLPVEFIDFELDEMLGAQLQVLHHNRRFAGIQYGGKKLDPQYVLHSVCNPHLSRLTGVPRAAFARLPWHRAIQSERNGDRLERKASGINMLIQIASGLSFVGDDGKPIIGQAFAQTIHNALTSGGAATVPLTMFRHADIKANPALAEVSPVKVTSYDHGSTGADIAAQISRLDAIDKRIIRSYGRPERSITEAVTAGSRADSESHADVGAMDSEQIHAAQCRGFNRQTLDVALVTNKGADWRGRLFYKPAQSSAADKAWKQKLWESLVENPQDAANGMTDRLRLAGEVEAPINANWKPPADPAGKTSVAVDGLKPDASAPEGDDADPSASLTDRERKIADEITA